MRLRVSTPSDTRVLLLDTRELLHADQMVVNFAIDMLRRRPLRRRDGPARRVLGGDQVSHPWPSVGTGRWLHSGQNPIVAE